MRPEERRGEAVRGAEEPITDVVFEAVNDGHERQDEVMRRAGEHGGEDVAASQPGTENRQDSFETEERDEAEEDANSDAARDGIWGIADGE